MKKLEANINKSQRFFKFSQHVSSNMGWAKQYLYVPLQFY